MLGVTMPPEVAERWNVQHLDGIEHREASASREAYERWESARWQGMLRDCGVEGPQAENLVNAIRFQVHGTPVEAYPETEEVLRDLRARGYRLGVCSNWHWDLEPSLEQAGIRDLVDVAITSARVGVRKDHPEIYRVTLEALEAEGAESLFVGDSWRPDVLGPLANGFAGAVHIDRWSSPGEPLPTGASRSADLRGVLAAL